MSLDRMRRVITGGARDVGETFTKPDDDWDSMFFFENPHGINALPLTFLLTRDADQRSVVAELLKHLISKAGAYRYGLVLNSWQLAGHPDDQGVLEYLARVQKQEVYIKDHPDAFEALTLTIGDAEEEQYWSAKIVRFTDKPPRLTTWERFGEGKDARFTGRFSHLNEYLRLPNTEGDK